MTLLWVRKAIVQPLAMLPLVLGGVVAMTQPQWLCPGQR